MPKVKVALIGVGNCASSFIQGIQYYCKLRNQKTSLDYATQHLRDSAPKTSRWLQHSTLTTRKVGKDLSEAIFAAPNNAPKICDIPAMGVKVTKGPLLDGVGEIHKSLIEVSKEADANVAQVLKHHGAEIVINLLPSGAAKATRYYAEQALAAGCAFVNATPNFIASDPSMGKTIRRRRTCPLSATT